MFARSFGDRDLDASIDGAALDAMAARSAGYSGSDIELVCKEAAMRPLRAIFDKLDAIETSEGATVSEGTAGKGGLCNMVGSLEELRAPAVTWTDVQEALRTTKATCEPRSLARYKKWEGEFGSV